MHNHLKLQSVSLIYQLRCQIRRRNNWQTGVIVHIDAVNGHFHVHVAAKPEEWLECIVYAFWHVIHSLTQICS